MTLRCHTVALRCHSSFFLSFLLFLLPFLKSLLPSGMDLTSPGRVPGGYGIPVFSLIPYFPYLVPFLLKVLGTADWNGDK